MTSRSKEKVAAAFRKLFRSPEKLDNEGAGPSGSPARGRGLLRRHRDGVSPAEAAASLPASPGAAALVKKKAAGATEARERAAAVRTRRLMKELKEIQRLQDNRPDPVFTVELVNDNLFEWHVRLHQIDPESELAGDLRELQIQHILLHLVFPENFPFAPPFMRVIEPRIEKGFVMEGGAICMELLTPRGWASAYTVEAVVMQFAASVVKGQGRVARAPPRPSREFSRRRAEEAFRSLVKTHDKYGWVTPALSDG
ncbi:ubiquitin-conjugating enzyme E2Q-like protein 1 [Amyelois transitella]|uniref:ubiquitin-conjugating enzyme E2Q-like protein 1 n=1 Tax=Amyelois transitella TaxID=680683 RepID=UPI00067A8218|nr:ubiquitin-conjugating enzyme E2Q-like protein 1 [Amyelois transitella]XP_060802430.1 ubiquitin-conjugating enzyme E2Q-like protein 1 [Amyelois transitella]XP_060802435.1 ubiquitin-conjugating enzyme E2Q-like protein 1 [Amyelois transitella]